MTLLYAILLMASVEAASAQDARFYIEGDTLYFNGNVPPVASNSRDMENGDATELGAYIMDFSEITTVDVRSDGGSLNAGIAMARNIQRFNLHTTATAGCYSACVYAFLGGTKRTLKRGGVLGFHRSMTSAETFRDVADQGIQDWNAKTAAINAFDRGIDAGVAYSQFLVSRGVSDEFILKVISTPPREIWSPSRAELVAAGVLNE